MSSDDDGEFGGLFGEEEVEQIRPDIEFRVNRSEWLNEGTTAANFVPKWDKVEDFSPCILTSLTLYQKDKHHSLWGHRIWNAAKYFSKLIDRGTIPVRMRSVLELGSGLGVPSLVAHQNGARVVVTTDYPDEDLLSILRKNVDANSIGADAHVNGGDPASNSDAPIRANTIHALPLLWGNKDHIESCLEVAGSGSGFDVVILSDIVFNHVCHHDLLKTVAITLAKDKRAAAYCAFSHHRPHKQKEDMDFFEKLPLYGLTWEKMDEEIYPLMFPEDPGAPEIRAPVHCFKIQHKFDDAGPPVDYNSSYDVVVQGSGLTETFVSAALSRHGLRVLHLDSNAFYGSLFNTLDIKQFTSHITKEFANVSIAVNKFESNDPTELSPQLLRKLQLDTLPMCYLSRGDLINVLVDSESANNVEFQNVDRVALFAPSTDATDGALRLHSVPLSRSDVFASKNFSPMEMRRMMKFVKDVEASLAEHEHAVGDVTSDTSAASPFATEDIAGESFVAFLKRKYQLNDKTVALLTMFGVLQAPATATASSVSASVNLLRTFLTSTGRYGGSTPFLAINYGSAELPQNMCRVSAVWNGTFILRRNVVATWRDDRKAYAVLSNGQRIETKAVVCAANNIGSKSSVPPLAVHRAVVVLKRPFFSWSDIEQDLEGCAPTDDETIHIRSSTVPLVVCVAGLLVDGKPASLQNVGSSLPVTIHQLSHATMQAPAGMWAVAHFTVNSSAAPMDSLRRFVTTSLHQKGITADDVVYEAYFTVVDKNPSNDIDLVPPSEVDQAIVQNHVFSCATLFDGVDDGAYAREAKRVFEEVVPHCVKFGVDEWANCPFPGGAKETVSAPPTSTSQPLHFLPPPPPEIVRQQNGITVGEFDDDAKLLDVKV